MDPIEHHETLTHNLYQDYKQLNDYEASSTQVFERQTENEVPNQWLRITGTEDTWQIPEIRSATFLPTPVSLYPPLVSQNEPTPEPHEGFQPWKPVFFGPAGSGSKGPQMTATEYESSEIFYGYRASYTGGSSSDGDRNNGRVVSDEWTCSPCDTKLDDSILNCPQCGRPPPNIPQTATQLSTQPRKERWFCSRCARDVLTRSGLSDPLCPRCQTPRR